MNSPGFKYDEEVMSKMKPPARIAALRLWFVILIILGFLAMLYVGYKILSKPKIGPTQQTSSFVGFLVPTVYAQSGQPKDSPASPAHDLKQDVMAGLFIVLAIVLLMSVWGVIFAKDATRVAAAGDILKTVLGFFIGAATALFK